MLHPLSQIGTPKIIVAMSGGVDSSVAAALLKRAGFNIKGVFLKLYDSPRFREGEKRAKKIAKMLKIPIRVLDLRKEFKKKVINYFLEDYRLGRTPNPCVVCNKEIKFKFLLKKAQEVGAGSVATGHYARLRQDKLLRAKDKEKDQSYFLWQLSQEQLKRVLFPVGGYTKEEVKTLARKFKLPVFEAPESQEVCFEFSLQQNPGPIRCATSEVAGLGRHQGLAFYTIGQRKGIKLAGGPFWVLDKNIKKNLLIVTKNEKDLYKKELIFEKANWISGKTPKFPIKVKAKIRYRHQPVRAILVSSRKLIFNRAQRAITPGQSVVFYCGQELLGGGIIKSVKRV